MYVDEPYDFKDGDIYHKHDVNPRINTWRCKNGHEFQVTGTVPCLGCYLEQDINNRRAREASLAPSIYKSNRRVDDHERQLPMSFNDRHDLF
jgi:hypothetical protein